MSTTTPNPEATPAADVQEAGEKVTGGADATSANASRETADEPAGEEYTPRTETTKEEVTGYNELPEQEKVGGA